MRSYSSFIIVVVCVSLSFLSCRKGDRPNRRGETLRQKTETFSQPNDHSKDITVRIPLFQNDSFIEMEFVYVEGGTFYMGGTSEQKGVAREDEYPVRKVTVEDFYISKYEVTQDVWWQLTMDRVNDMAAQVSELPNRVGDRYPMHFVSWDDCQIFITYLNDRCISQVEPYMFSFLTEAQWEYAARGGKYSKARKYCGSDDIEDVAVYWKNSGDKFLSGSDSRWSFEKVFSNHGHMESVGSHDANELGIYDMSGNVKEWCYDSYSLYIPDDVQGPISAVSTQYRVLRGGSWVSKMEDCRVSARESNIMTYKDAYTGLRLALTR